MGSMIHLAVGQLEIDWGKNYAFTDHSPLFQITDVSQVPYYYVDDDAPESAYLPGKDRAIKAEYKEGMSKRLKEVADRINLLGYTERYAEAEFAKLAAFNDLDHKHFPFKKLADALASVDVQTISHDYSDGGYDFGEFFRKEIYPRLGLTRTNEEPHSALFDKSMGMENLSTYCVLQLLAKNPQAKELPVYWAFDDLAQNGWAKRTDFVRELAPENKFLIVTEGSSDVLIIKHAFKLLKPHIADFFQLVDLEEGYPFTGTGSLVNFVKGLISISIQNNVIVIFDNDAEGVASLQKCAALNIPDNMHILKLPDSDDFQTFKTLGPSGNSIADVNGTAAAIECYLDTKGSGVVRWKNYNAHVNAYQGELIEKDKYKKEFLSQKQVDPNYNYARISSVVQMIIEKAISMKEKMRLKHINEQIYDPER